MDGHVTIIGCGNIGSALCGLLARMQEIQSLTLIDPGVYEHDNLSTQNISLAEVGMPKAHAMRRFLKRIRPNLPITTHICDVESLPYGALSCSVICACLDSRLSRLHVNEVAWRLGVPWIDSGVLASERLTRIEIFLPAMSAPCLECAFTQQHYDTMEVRHPCQKGPSSAAPTNAPAYLGALAASLQAAEVDKLLHGQRDEQRAGEQVLYGLNGHRHYVSHNRRNPECRFDHRVFAPQEISGRLRLKDLLFPVVPADRMSMSSESVSLSAPGQRFLRREPCQRCGRIDRPIQCVGTRDSPVQSCRFCGDTSTCRPGMLQEHLRCHDIPARLLARGPAALGLRPGDLLTVEDQFGERHYLIAQRPHARRLQTWTGF